MERIKPNLVDGAGWCNAGCKPYSEVHDWDHRVQGTCALIKSAFVVATYQGDCLSVCPIHAMRGGDLLRRVVDPSENLSDVCDDIRDYLGLEG
jgi:hypothetical protein